MSLELLPTVNEQLQKIMDERGLHWAQREAHEAFARDMNAGHRRIYGDMAMGSGKSALPLTHFEACFRAGVPVTGTIFTDSQENIVNLLAKEAPKWAPELVKSGRLTRFLPSDTDVSPFNVTSYHGGSQGLRTGSLRPPTLGYLDEAQGSLSDARQELFGSFKDVSQIIGLTATPAYSIRKSLDWAGFKESYKLPFEEAVARSLLCSYRNIILEVEDDELSLDKIDITRGDFDEKQLEKLMERSSIRESVRDYIQHWQDPATGQSYLHDRKGLFSCVTVANAIETAEYYNHAFQKYMSEGVSFVEPIWSSSIDAGAMSQGQRDDIVGRFREGKIRYAATKNLLITGYDDEEIDTIFNLRPTPSMVVVPQRAGRTVRFNHRAPDKVAHIIDVVLPGKNQRQMLFADYAGETQMYTDALQQRIDAGLYDLDGNSKAKDESSDEEAEFDEEKEKRKASVPPYKVYYDRREARSYIVSREQRRAIAKRPWLAESTPGLLAALIKKDILSKRDLIERIRELAFKHDWDYDVTKTKGVGGALSEANITKALKGVFMREREQERKEHFNKIRPSWQAAKRKFDNAMGEEGLSKRQEAAARMQQLEAELQRPPMQSYEMAEVAISMVLGGHPSKLFGDIKVIQGDVPTYPTKKIKHPEHGKIKVQEIPEGTRMLRELPKGSASFDPDYIFPDGTMEGVMNIHGGAAQRDFKRLFAKLVLEDLQELTEAELYHDCPDETPSESLDEDDTDTPVLNTLDPKNFEDLISDIVEEAVDLDAGEEANLIRRYQRHQKRQIIGDPVNDFSVKDPYIDHQTEKPIDTTSDEFALAALNAEWPSLSKAPAPDAVLNYKSAQTLIARALSSLTPREERVLRMRFGLDNDRDMTLEEVGAEFNVSRERIRQIETKGLRKLKHPSRSRYLRDLLGEEMAAPAVDSLRTKAPDMKLELTQAAPETQEEDVVGDWIRENTID